MTNTTNDLEYFPDRLDCTALFFRDKAGARPVIGKAFLTHFAGLRNLMIFDCDSLVHFCDEALSGTDREIVRLRILINNADDYQILRKIWGQLREKAGTANITLDISFVPYNEIAPDLALQQKVQNLTVSFEDQPDFTFANKLTAFHSHINKDSYNLLALQAPLYWPQGAEHLYLSTKPSLELFNALKSIDLCEKSIITFFLGNSIDLFAYIDRDFWKIIFSSCIPKVYQCDDSLTVEPLKMSSVEHSDISAVYFFPEPIVPARRAFVARSLDFLLGLVYSGVPTAAVMISASKCDEARVLEALSIFSPMVKILPYQRGKLPTKNRLLKWLEAKIRRKIGIQTSLTMRFTERCYRFNNDFYTKALGDVLEELPSIKNFIYTCAWFMPAIMPLKTAYPNIKWFCDTHDVFFKLDHTVNMHERRFFYSPKLQKKMEINLLRKADGIIAISEDDADSFSEAKANELIFMESGSFSHTAKMLDRPPGTTDLIFGFIGSNNSNNEKCLQIIRTDWWPRINAVQPNANLLVAGPICKSAEAEKLASDYPTSVTLLGFVDSLGKFYGSVQAMLSPIAVQGGLNFKSVETLIAGLPLITNELGTRCVGVEQEGVIVLGPEPESIEAILDRLKSRDQAEWKPLIQRAALAKYGNDVAYKKLIEFINR